MRALDWIWFTEMGGKRPIGVVLGIDDITKKKKAYIGTVNGENEVDDVFKVMTQGAKFPLEAAEQMLEGG